MRCFNVTAVVYFDAVDETQSCMQYTCMVIVKKKVPVSFFTNTVLNGVSKDMKVVDYDIIVEEFHESKVI